jgi:hypothetical protein
VEKEVRVAPPRGDISRVNLAVGSGRPRLLLQVQRRPGRLLRLPRSNSSSRVDG